MAEKTEAQPKILIIHQDEVRSRAIKKELEREGYQLTIASGEKAGLDQVREINPDLIIFENDVLYQRIRSRSALAEIPVVTLGEESEGTEKDDLEVGPAGLADRAFQAEDMKSRLRNLLSDSGLPPQDGEEQLFQLLFEYAPDAMYLNDYRGNFLDGNLAAEEITGYQREELIGKNFIELKLLSKRDLPRAAALLAKDALGRSTGPDVFTLIAKGGKKVPVEIRTFPITFGDKRIVLGTARDISERWKAEQKLRESESHYRSLFQDSPLSLWEEDWSQVGDYFQRLRDQGVTDFHSYFGEHPEAVQKCVQLVKILDVNQSTLDLHQAETKEELLGSLDKVFTPDSNEKFVQELAAVAEGATDYQDETIHLSLTGEKLHVFFRLHIPPLYEESLEKVIVSMMNITERVRLEQELASREEFLRGVLKSAPDAILTIDQHDRVVNWNPGAVRMFGYSREEVMGKNIDDLIAGGEKQTEAAEYTRLVSRGQSVPPTEIVRYHKDGHKVHVVLSASAIMIADEFRGSVAVYTDVSELAAAREKIRHLANHDKLTGLPNRRLFESNFTQMLKIAERDQIPFAVLILDLDNFKEINDTHGHAVGDQLLSWIGERLPLLLRASDTVARWGGDEFAFLLYNTGTREGVESVLNKIYSLFQKPVKIDQINLEIEASVGAALFPGDGKTEEELLHHADQAMYRAKSSGGDTYRFCGDDEDGS
ncbi:MAG: PAS domain S-box protein [Anaerolineales bacterium]|nr:PAS domain S-box protein [Anaerolineales bacterium]